VGLFKKQKVVVGRRRTKVVQMPKKVIVGYQNYADYNGVEISMFSKEPLEFIEIKAAISFVRRIYPKPL
jgi:hypothetical protein